MLVICGIRCQVVRVLICVNMGYGWVVGLPPKCTSPDCVTLGYGRVVGLLHGCLLYGSCLVRWFVVVGCRFQCLVG